jgi:response regulator RpfG family c-di-GMP phosphodiesterase
VQRVQKLTHAIASEIRRGGHYLEQLSPDFMDMVGMASILHDVGKVGTPDHILFKPGKLDPDERRIMEQHASIGASILAKSAQMVEGQSYLSLGSEIAGGHHEHFDGNGYPQKLSGQAIPLSARIVAVVDVFDALLNKRPYKEPWELSETLDYIRSVPAASSTRWWSPRCARWSRKTVCPSSCKPVQHKKAALTTAGRLFHA